MTATAAPKPGEGMATCLRVYIEIGEEAEAQALAEKINAVLLGQGYNETGKLNAVIACVAGTPDVAAWAQGTDEFFARMRVEKAGFLVIPKFDDEGEGA